jgi:hypothetical protein
MSTQGFSRLSSASAHQSFMLGLNRSPLTLPEEVTQAIRGAPADVSPALTALAVAGTQIRFARPSVAQAALTIPEAALRLHADPRSFLPAKARRHLQRLVFNSDVETCRIIVGAALKRLNARGLRFHPFDLPRLAASLRSCGVLPGVAERAYLALTQSASEDEPQEHLFHERMTPENWRDFGKAARVRFLAELRAKDRAAGLALLQDRFAQDPAALRSELVLALSVGLSAADQAFLESLEKDRAESVRTAAGKLLAHLPGTDAYKERLNLAAASFEVKRARILKTKVVFTPPHAVPPGQTGFATYALLDNIAIQDLADRLGMTVDAFLEALPDSEEAVLGAFAQTAIANNVADVVAVLIPRLSADALDFLITLMPQSGSVGEVQHALLSRFIAELKDRAYPRASGLIALQSCLTEPLPSHMAKSLLASSSWRAYLAALAEPDVDGRKIDPDSLLYTATLLPAESMQSFLATIASLPPAVNRKAHEFADFVLALPASSQTPIIAEG